MESLSSRRFAKCCFVISLQNGFNFLGFLCIVGVLGGLLDLIIFLAANRSMAMLAVGLFGLI
jgi:hypothetical protein